MAISTVPNFPFALVVDMELLNFNHKPFMPMINDFNQAVHWGKYRQYMGKAAGALHEYVNGSFLMKNSDDKKDAGKKEEEQYKLESSYSNEKIKTNIVSEWSDGKNLSFYVPAETQTKIFLPDSVSFRSDQEKIQQDYGKDFWGSILQRVGLDVNLDSQTGYGIDLPGVYNLSRQTSVSTSIKFYIKDAIDFLTAGITHKDSIQKIYAHAAQTFVTENKLGGEEKNFILNYDQVSFPAGSVKRPFTYDGKLIGGKDREGISIKIHISAAKQYLKTITNDTNAVIDDRVETITREKAEKLGFKEGSKEYSNLKKSVKNDFKNGFNLMMYERFFKSVPIEALMEAAREKQGAFSFREWEVPMIKIDLDPKAAIVTGVSLTLGNNLAKLQFQMQDEPTYQHIGGTDTSINISMRVIGEQELTKIKRVFDHVNALARLEHSTGVIGFIGIKNIITALAGVKYVLPSNYSVNTVPNYPHVYDVNISLLDFDIFQQEREMLSSKHQKQLITEFGTKRNPFLRIKQMWGLFNAYPDLPLQLRDKDNEIVGHLDPDFYFRSFEMFDKDIINNYSQRPKELSIPTNGNKIGEQASEILTNITSDKIVNLIRNYRNSMEDDRPNTREINKLLLDDVIDYLEINNISYDSFLKLFAEITKNPQPPTSKSSDSQVYNVIKNSKKFITERLEYTETVKVGDETATFNNKIQSGSYRVGDLSASGNYDALTAALAGKYNLKEESEISFDLDELDFQANIYQMPIQDKNDPNKIPSILSIGAQVHLGYIDIEKDGRFYLTVDGSNVTKEGKLNGGQINDDFSDPTLSNKNNFITGLSSMSEYGKPYSNNMESHWENILIDTQYRDVSGRMLRAFPTYMLWLIDEGGHFAGVKVFDNFYGLQSIIDFSVVSSEDLLGDTLILRLSNLYSKLSKKESTSIFNPNLDKDGEDRDQDNPGITEGLSSILDRTLNKARYLMAHMRNDYVVDIENIRLKPGVRVHLRGGYGANPNSLQTLFNGTITQVDQGQIVTVTAQSDAIELGAVVNSTKKKGDSGKIDGGINTGLWLSEPRDLMVRLLSMGASRFRESIAHANRGMIFSENKFGIRHFGNMLYQPMSLSEEQKHQARIDSMADAYNAVGNFNFSDPALRPDAMGLMQQISASFSSQRDLEIFKRNIYPGNGSGVAQFLGGDLGDGWTSVASLTPQDQPNERMEYLSGLTDRSWNNLISKSVQSGGTDAKEALDNLVSGGKLSGSDEKSIDVTKALLVATLAIPLIPVAPLAAGVIAGGGGLLGVVSGKSGNNFFRMLGLASANNDDDMPGFDEVSFRAQTYMRSVWDLFQVCARMLPNYIVAVRPFEDRSTIFYGKPHWLYTSGVVPITTGHPTEEKMSEMGLSTGPKIIDPDLDLASIMAKINRDASPYADANAFLRSKEPADALLQLSNEQKVSGDIFKTSGFLKNKIINFDSTRSAQVIGLDRITKKAKIKAKLPVNKGLVTIGFHLPNKNKQPHKQIAQLPTRFRYPFFANKGISDEYKLDTSAFRFSSSSSRANPRLNEEGIKAIYGEEFVINLRRDINLIRSRNLSGIILSNPLENAYSFVVGVDQEVQQIEMPFPDFLSKSGEISFQEWGTPQTPGDAQFHIAMQWPYIPSTNTDVDKFVQKYFPNLSSKDLVGEARDYKDCHVMVYNPDNNIAVVCKPAYFLWGDTSNNQLYRRRFRIYG